MLECAPSGRTTGTGGPPHRKLRLYPRLPRRAGFAKGYAQAERLFQNNRLDLDVSSMTPSDVPPGCFRPDDGLFPNQVVRFAPV
jgi:hypothetical protein